MLGSWHAQLYTIDHRQCMMFCHDTTRFVLFLPGLRKEHFATLGKWFRELYSASLTKLECSTAQIKKVELQLGPIWFDSATDRSVQGSMRVAKLDFDASLMRVPNVMDLDPVSVSYDLNHRPATVHSELIWPDKLMKEMVSAC